MMNLYLKSCKQTIIKLNNYGIAIGVVLMKNIKEMFF